MKTLVHGIMRDLDAEDVAYAARTKAIRLASESHARNELARICAEYELEPDECSTAGEKAQAILDVK